MAYISTEEVAVIRNNLKVIFPSKDGWKLSVRREDARVVHVAVIKSPVKIFADVIDPSTMAGRYLGNAESDIFSIPGKIVMKKIWEIVDAKNYDNSQPQYDYFDRGYYSRVKVGEWNKPYEVVSKKRKD